MLLTIRLLAVAVFSIAAWSDHQTRSAPNVLWIAIGSLGVIALVVELAAQSNPHETVVGVAIVVALAWILALVSFASGVIGGADAKAVMVLPVAFPHMPGQPFQSGVFEALTQGVEAVIVVWIGAAVVGLWWPVQQRVLGRDVDNIPFLIPIFGGVLALVVVGCV